MRLQSDRAAGHCLLLLTPTKWDREADRSSQLPQAGTAFTETTSKGTGEEQPASKRTPQLSHLRGTPYSALQYRPATHRGREGGHGVTWPDSACLGPVRGNTSRASGRSPLPPGRPGQAATTPGPAEPSRRLAAALSGDGALGSLHCAVLCCAELSCAALRWAALRCAALPLPAPPHHRSSPRYSGPGTESRAVLSILPPPLLPPSFRSFPRRATLSAFSARRSATNHPDWEHDPRRQGSEPKTAHASSPPNSSLARPLCTDEGRGWEAVSDLVGRVWYGGLALRKQRWVVPCTACSWADGHLGERRGSEVEEPTWQEKMHVILNRFRLELRMCLRPRVVGTTAVGERP